VREGGAHAAEVLTPSQKWWKRKRKLKKQLKEKQKTLFL
jgi:hypothetical protein